MHNVYIIDVHFMYLYKRPLAIATGLLDYSVSVLLASMDGSDHRVHAYVRPDDFDFLGPVEWR